MTARVLGYVVQCGICPQRAVLDEQVTGWVCPRCAEVAAPISECRLHQLARCPLCDHHDPIVWHIPDGDVVDGWITCNEQHPVTGYYCGLPEGHTADHMTQTMTWPRRAHLDDEPCASPHPVIRDHLCGKPFGHTGDHSTHVMYWPNHSAPAADDDEQEWLRKVQG